MNEDTGGNFNFLPKKLNNMTERRNGETTFNEEIATKQFVMHLDSFMDTRDILSEHMPDLKSAKTLARACEVLTRVEGSDRDRLTTTLDSWTRRQDSIVFRRRRIRLITPRVREHLIDSGFELDNSA